MKGDSHLCQISSHSAEADSHVLRSLAVGVPVPQKLQELIVTPP